MTSRSPEAPAASRRTDIAVALTAIGLAILAVDVVLGLPSLLVVLSDPMSHEARDAGMTAMFLLIPLALAGLIALVLGFIARPTRAGATAAATVSAVVLLVWASIGGTPTILPAVGVAIVGAALTVWLATRESGRAGPRE